MSQDRWDSWWGRRFTISWCKCDCYLTSLIIKLTKSIFIFQSPTPDDYYRDWPSSDTQNNDNEEPRSSHSAERIYSETNAERSYSPQDFSSTRNQRYQGEYSSSQNNGSNSQSSQGYDTSSERIFRTPSGDRIIDTTKNKRGVITSAEGRPCTSKNKINAYPIFNRILQD